MQLSTRVKLREGKGLVKVLAFGSFEYCSISWLGGKKKTKILVAVQIFFKFIITTVAYPRRFYNVLGRKQYTSPTVISNVCERFNADYTVME